MSYGEWKEKVIGKEKLEYHQKAYKNREKDKEQYAKYVLEMGTEHLPKSFDKFQELKYNDSERYEQLKTRYHIKTKRNLTVEIGKQGKHLLGHNNYQNGSYVFDTVDIQELVNKYAGSGELKLDKNGKWIQKEFIEHKEEIGVHISKDKKEKYNTKRFSIHYSKNGVHIVPRERKK